MAAALLSLRDIAHGFRRSYTTVKIWANDPNWPKPKVTVNRSIGRCAMYSADEVYAYFDDVADAVAARQERDAA